MIRRVSILISTFLLVACGTTEKPVTYVPSSVIPSTSESYNDNGTGIPPTPSAEARKAYLAELNSIDPDIVHGKEQTAVDRGRNQCSSIKAFPNDEKKWLELTKQRFTSPTHPDGFGVVKSSKILVAVRKYLCPNY